MNSAAVRIRVPSDSVSPRSADTERMTIAEGSGSSVFTKLQGRLSPLPRAQNVDARVRIRS